MATVDSRRLCTMTEIALRPEDAKYFKNLSQVAEMTMQGASVSAIMRETGLTRADTVKLQTQWKESMVHNHEARDRALDALNVMDEHYDKLINQAYKTLEQIEDDLTLNGTTPQRIQQKLNALKLVADLERQRLDALQKAGLLDMSAMGNQMAEVEDKQQKLIAILRNDLCPDCRKRVALKLQEVTGKVEVVRVDE